MARARASLTHSEECWLFYFHLGFAITRWANIEESLIALLCESFGDEKSGKILIKGFFSIENFRSKLAFVDALLAPRVTDAFHLEEWGKLMERISRASTKRNKLAHHRVLAFARAKAGRRYGLASSFELKKTDAHESDAICISELVSFQAEFDAVYEAVMQFSHRLRNAQGQPPRFPARLPDLPTIQTLKSQMHAALGHPLESSRGKS